MLSFLLGSSFFPVYKHDKKCGQQKHGAYEYGLPVQELDNKIAENSADNEEKDDSIVEKRIPKRCYLSGVEKTVEIFRSAS